MWSMIIFKYQKSICVILTTKKRRRQHSTMPYAHQQPHLWIVKQRRSPISCIRKRISSIWRVCEMYVEFTNHNGKKVHSYWIKHKFLYRISSLAIKRRLIKYFLYRAYFAFPLACVLYCCWSRGFYIVGYTKKTHWTLVKYIIFAAPCTCWRHNFVRFVGVRTKWRRSKVSKRWISKCWKRLNNRKL